MSAKDPMYSEYIKFYNKYTMKYGPKTTVFMAVGSFYELYDIQNTETGDTQCNINEITNFLGLQLTTKTYAKLKLSLNSDEQIVCAGFPDYSIHKWAGRLTSTGWTVVVVDQSADGRVVSRILSPSTHIENMSSLDTPYILSLFFQQSSPNNTPIFGSAILDLTTGKTITYSGITNGRPDIWTADDLIHMINVFQPKELIIYWKSQQPAPDKSYIFRTFGIPTNTPIHIYQLDTLGTFAIELARSEYLQKIYSIKSLFPPKTYLGLRSDQEELALLYLLQFIEEHYPSILKSFHRNEPWTPQSRLICGNHALTQLQMTGSNISETVVNLFNKCITPMGKRAIRDRLLTPYSDHNKISQYLNEVQEYSLWDVLKTKQLEKQLRFMFDLPRLHRKLLCGLVTSQEISGLFQTYTAINAVMTEIAKSDSLLKEPFKKEEWDVYNRVYQTHFSFEKSQHTSEDITSFNSDTYTNISKKEKEIEDTHAEFTILKHTITDKGGIQEDSISIESRTKEPYGFKCTANIIRQLKKNLSNLPPGTKLSELKTVGWIDCTKLQQLNTTIQKLREQLHNLVKIHILDACNAISEAGQLIWTSIETWISHIDCTQCIGHISKERGFVCPKIYKPDENGSSFEIEQLRHPLVEASATRISYVKHDIRLGFNESTQSSNGWLIYGMNASGKSTLMKATGLCILLAQSGCFVPAKSMTLKPFKSIYTRILNQDNLFAGLSSFAVEMSELRDILKNANSHTLVLGDELCAGTESVSAQSLVLSGIQWLSTRNAKFIFATHLHGLADMLSCQNEPKCSEVQVWHLHVEYDPITKKLIYDRALRPGSGSTLYGLEVAQAMDLPFEFIEQALQNRHRIIGSKCQENVSKSYWNSEIIRKECEICKTQICSELEVHHIVPRAMAINNILEDGSHMNEKRNLIVICQSCHDKVHANKIEIGPLQITSDGPERVIKESDKIHNTYTPLCQMGAAIVAGYDSATFDSREYCSFEKKAEQMNPCAIETQCADLSDTITDISPLIISPDTKKKTRKGKWSDDEMTIIRDTLQSYASLSLKSVRSYLSSKYSIEISECILGKLRRNVY